MMLVGAVTSSIVSDREVIMRKIAITLAVAGTVLALAPAASAREGCGRGFHRGPYGRCIVNRGPAYVAPAPGVRLVIGNYYGGRGYWDGRRYWQHRYRYNNGWRYR
jgi:hypothetical protein